MICRKCGKEIGDHEKFCRYCGEPHCGVEKQEKKGGKKRWILAGVLAAAVAVILVLVFRASPKSMLEQALKSRDYDQALELCQKSIKNGRLQEDMEELLKQAMDNIYAAYSGGEMESGEAKRILKQIGELFTGDIAEKAGGVESLVDADENFSQEKYEDAVAFYRTALEQWPELDAAAFGLEKASEAFRAEIIEHADTYSEKEEYEKALEEIDHGLEVLEKDPQMEAKKEEINQRYEKYLENRKAVSVKFTVKTEKAEQYAIISGLNQDGTEVWKKKTDAYPVTELDCVCEVGISKDTYYYTEGGTVAALNLSDGTVLWKNEDFGGYSVSAAIGEDGNLYLCGYYGPDFFVVDPEGKTLCRIDSFSDEFQWAHAIQCGGGQAVVTVTRAADGAEVQIPVSLSDYSYVLPEEPSGNTAMSLEDICRAVEEYYKTKYGTEYYAVFPSESLETDSGYYLTLRYQGGNTANVFASGIEVNIQTGQVTDDWGGSWNLYE